MADIFVSYKREDIKAVERIVRLLRNEGFEVWWDTNINTGQSFSEVIRREIDKAGCVVVVWSQGSVASPYVTDEAGLARTRKILVPINLDGVELPFGFGGIQTVSFKEWNGKASARCAQELLNGVRLVLGQEARPIREPARDPAPKKPAGEATGQTTGQATGGGTLGFLLGLTALVFIGLGLWKAGEWVWSSPSPASTTTMSPAPKTQIDVRRLKELLDEREKQ